MITLTERLYFKLASQRGEGQPERRRQLGGVMTEVVDRDAGGKAYMKRHRVRIECMLDYYYDSFRINDPQLKAGLKFREIYLRVNFGTNCKILCNPFLMEAGQADPEGKAHAHLHCLRMLDEAYCKLPDYESRKSRSLMVGLK